MTPPRAGRLPFSLHLLVVAALVALPSVNTHIFNGLPFSTLPEYLLAVAGLPVLFGAELRRLAGRWYGHTRWRGPLLSAALVAVALKLVLLGAGSHAGFAACYSSPAAPGPCERSYEYPFSRWTRFDRTLDFAPERWNLSFINSVRFNYYRQGERSRTWMPISASWDGQTNRDASVLRISYTGQGIVAIGSEQTVLPDAYEQERTVDVPIQGQGRRLRVGYTYDDGHRTGEPNPRPYATFRVTARDASGTPVLLPGPVALWQRAAGRAIDAIVLCEWAAFAWLYVFLLRERAARAAAVACGGALVVAASLLAADQPVAGRLVFAAVSFVVLGALCGGRPRRTFWIGWTGLLVLGLLMSDAGGPAYDTVRIAGGGNDPLTYESFARTILETWQLRGGESIYYYQILYRYIRFLEHLVLGDAQPFITMAAHGAVVGAILWACCRLQPWRIAPRWARHLAYASAASTLAIAVSGELVAMVQFGLSEYPTWVLLPVLVVTLGHPLQPRRVIPGACAAAVSMLTRMNQAPALLALVVRAVVRSGSRLRNGLAAACVLGALVAGIPYWHNATYGGRNEILLRSTSIPQNLIVRPAELLHPSPTVNARVRSQLEGVLRPYPLQTRSLKLLLATAALIWMASTIGVLLAGTHRMASLELLAMPAIYLGVHVFYQVAPRHVMAGYLAMGLFSMAALRLAGDVRSTDRQPDHSGVERRGGHRE